LISVNAYFPVQVAVKALYWQLDTRRSKSFKPGKNDGEGEKWRGGRLGVLSLFLSLSVSVSLSLTHFLVRSFKYMEERSGKPYEGAGGGEETFVFSLVFQE
jgi:hypothetical protein